MFIVFTSSWTWTFNHIGFFTYLNHIDFRELQCQASRVVGSCDPKQVEHQVSSRFSEEYYLAKPLSEDTLCHRLSSVLSVQIVLWFCR